MHIFQLDIYSFFNKCNLLKTISTESGLNNRVGFFTTGQYIAIHGGIVAIIISLTHLRVIPYAKLCVSASQKLHDLMFSTMIKGIMRFFDTSSSGMIFLSL